MPLAFIFAVLCTISAAADDPREILAPLDTEGLRDVRLICINGLASELHKRQIRRGHRFPEPDAYCRAAEEISAGRGEERELFAAIALAARVGASRAPTTQDWAHARSEESIPTLNAIVASALAGTASFTGLTGQTHPYRPELAYAAGMAYAMINPDKLPPLGDTSDHEAAWRACFASIPGDTIMIAGSALPMRRVCLLAGAQAAKGILRQPRVERG